MQKFVFSFKQLIFLIIVQIFLINHTFAGDVVRAERIVSLSNPEQTTESLRQYMMKFISDLEGLISRQRKLSEAEYSSLVRMVSEKTDPLLKRLDNVRFREESIKIYADAFTDDELDQIIAFYSSSVGRRMQKKQDELRLMKTNEMNKLLNELTAEIRPLIFEVAGSIKPEHNDNATKGNILKVIPHQGG